MVVCGTPASPPPVVSGLSSGSCTKREIVVTKGRGELFGARLGWVDDKLVVLHVRRDSPAYRIGLCFGDCVTGVNGLLLGEANLAAIHDTLQRSRRLHVEVEDAPLQASVLLHVPTWWALRQLKAPLRSVVASLFRPAADGQTLEGTAEDKVQMRKRACSVARTHTVVQVGTRSTIGWNDRRIEQLIAHTLQLHPHVQLGIMHVATARQLGQACHSLSGLDPAHFADETLGLDEDLPQPLPVVTRAQDTHACLCRLARKLLV